MHMILHMAWPIPSHPQQISTTPPHTSPSPWRMMSMVPSPQISVLSTQGGPSPLTLVDPSHCLTLKWMLMEDCSLTKEAAWEPNVPFDLVDWGSGWLVARHLSCCVGRAAMKSYTICLWQGGKHTNSLIARTFYPHPHWFYRSSLCRHAKL